MPFGRRHRVLRLAATLLAVTGVCGGLEGAKAEGEDGLARSRAIMEAARQQGIPEWARPEIGERERGLAQQILRQSRAIHEDELAVEAKTAGIETSRCDDPSSAVPDRQVLIFASWSLPQQTLERYLEEARDPGVTVVFRGLREGDNLQSFSRRFDDYRKDADDGRPEANVILEPTLFKRFNVERAPTLVLVRRGADPVMVTGAVPVAWLREKAASLAKGKAANLGQRAETYVIEERDLIEEIQRRAAAIDWEKKRETAIANVWRHQTFQSLPEAEKTETRELDASFIVSEDVRDATGKVLVSKGTLINPFQIVPFTKDVFVFNAQSRKQVELVRKAVQQSRNNHTPVVLITTELDRERGWDQLKELEGALEAPVYLLTEQLRSAMQLTAVPAVLRGQDDRLFVTTIRVKGS